jgi:DNA-binding FadR family transcriptional regulator
VINAGLRKGRVKAVGEGQAGNRPAVPAAVPAVVWVGGRVGGRVRPPKVAELVVDDVRARIVGGELADGATLPAEAALMACYGVSRPTLREAFRVLESEALLTVRRGSRGGARVHAPTEGPAARYTAMLLRYRGVGPDDVRAAQHAVETSCVSVLASRRDPADVAALGAALDVLENAAVTAPDPGGVARAVEDFRRVVVTRAGNATLYAVWEILGQLPDATATGHPPAGADDVAAHRIVRAHRVAVTLIRRGDPHTACRHWTEQFGPPAPAPAGGGI